MVYVAQFILMKTILYSTILLTLLTACSGAPEPIDLLNDASFSLLDQDSTVVNFPGDFKDKTVLMGFIYTNCPDVCPLITGNMKKVQVEMDDPSDVEFIILTFDPARDTPSVLNNYHRSFELNERFHMLTGDTTIVNTLLDRLKVRTQISFSSVTDEGKRIYFMNHSDKLITLNKRGEWVYEYGGSMTPSSYLIEDINKIR